MAWTSTTAVIGIDIDGAPATRSNNALIVGDDWGNFLEVAGANDTVTGSNNNDKARQMNGSTLKRYLPMFRRKDFLTT